MKQLTNISKSYPQLLAEISDPPKNLYISGAIPDQPFIAIVGSRTPTNYGREITYRLAYDLASLGVCIVSGLAYGIDTIAHQAAIDAKGQTVAVLGSGLNQIYPRANAKLATQIADGNGAVISEYEASSRPLPFHFPQRNRIIAGLSQGIIVTEANAKSGSLITAALALDANRTVMAVPGNITNPRSAGPNYLLKMGAVPVTDAHDVISILGIEIDQSNQDAEIPHAHMSAIQKQIVNLIHSGITSTPALVDHLPAAASETIIAIGGLEMAGIIKQIAIGQWTASKNVSGLAKSTAKL